MKQLLFHINRSGFCMADDCSNHLVNIEVENQEELEDYLRGYLPYAYKNECWVWIIYKCCKTNNIVFLYYYLTPIISYFVSPVHPPVLKNHDSLFCSLITEKWAQKYKDFSMEGNFLNRVRDMVENRRIAI